MRLSSLTRAHAVAAAPVVTRACMRALSTSAAVANGCLAHATGVEHRRRKAHVPREADEARHAAPCAAGALWGRVFGAAPGAVLRTRSLTEPLRGSRCRTQVWHTALRVLPQSLAEIATVTAFGEVRQGGHSSA
jgi:hypothetical protein